MAAVTLRIKLVTFDAYNTLFTPKGNVFAHYVQEAMKHDIQVTLENVTHHWGLAYKNQLKKAPFYGLHHKMTTEQWWQELVYATFLGAGVDKKDLDVKFNPLFSSLFNRFKTSEGYDVFADVHETLVKLKRHGFRMGVISNSDERLISVMKSLELDQYFDFVLPSYIAKAEKPDIAIFEAARRLAGGSAVHPDQILHVGDDVEKDYHGALNAGWHSVLLQRAQDDAPQPVKDNSRCYPQTIATLHELFPILTCEGLSTATAGDKSAVIEPPLVSSQTTTVE